MIVEDKIDWAFPQRTVSGIDCRLISRSQINACCSSHGLLSQPSWVRKTHFPSSNDDLHGHHERTEKQIQLMKSFISSLDSYCCIDLYHQQSKMNSVVVVETVPNVSKENVLISSLEQYHLNELNVHQLRNMSLEQYSKFVYSERF